MQSLRCTVILILSLLTCISQSFAKNCPTEYIGSPLEPICQEIDKQSPKSGTLVLDGGETALYSRAWLADHATREINVQYFIWSSDNIGILAAEELLRAAERGVKVRVIVDDLMMDATSESLLALARHPNIDIKIYNPVHKVGVSKVERVYHLITDFRNANQRMHDKTMIVDNAFAITGGRNMADEYFDYDQKYNFRDRDVLLMGPVVTEVKRNFEQFWNHPLAKQVEAILDVEGLLIDDENVIRVYNELHAYAQSPENFSPHIQQIINRLPEKFPELMASVIWSATYFLSDFPGKNDGNHALGGGGLTTSAMVELIRGARKSIVIQSPYLVFPDGALDFFKKLIARGVSIKVSTNSLASTDNLMAFSGYRKQRQKILAAGVEIYEFKPHPAIQTELIKRYPQLEHNSPIFAIHAKTLVIDGKTTFIGTFNFDPRSANLNTEVGVVIHDRTLSEQVEKSIFLDMATENSWNPRTENPDQHAPLGKKIRLGIWRIFPLTALL